MTKYIWITVGVISLILILAYKQAPKEPELERPLDEIASELPFEQEEGEAILSESGNIKITRPQPDSNISSPVLVKGEARVFEGTIQLRLKNSEGTILTEKTATALTEEAGEFGSFGELLLFDEVDADSGELEVYSIDAQDGGEVNVVSIPIKF
jgi:hypothetical protein